MKENKNLSEQGRPGPGRPPTLKDPVRLICDAASSLFAEEGYDTTSLQEVAKAVGVTKAGLYHYFPTKQALFDTIVLNTLKELYAAALSAVAEKQDHEAKLTRFMIAHATYFADHPDKYRASFFSRGGREMSNYTPEQIQARKDYTRLLEEILDSGVRAGAFEIADVRTLSRGILGMLNWMARWFRADGPQTAPQIAESYAITILAGIARG